MIAELTAGVEETVVLPNRFHFGREEREAVDALFDAAARTGEAPGYNGEEESAFCREFAALVGAPYADGVNSGTNAVYVALKALELPPFSEVAVGCVTDPGGMMPVVLNNCLPVPVDTRPGTFNAGAPELEARITERTRAIVVAHIGGEPADLPGIMAVAAKYGIPVVEDCAQSHLARIHGRQVGTFGVYGAFSLMFGKHVCTGGQGGAVVCSNEEAYWRERRAADRGKPFNLPAGDGNVIPALNCNMDEIHAAIGRVQLKKLPGIVGRRRCFAQQMIERGFGELAALSIPALPPGFEHSYWWWRLRFRPERMRCTKAEYCAALTAAGVQVIPDYSAALPARMAWFRDRAARFPWNNPGCGGNPAADYPTPNADRAVEAHFILRIFESYGEEQADQLIALFRALDRKFAR